MFVFSLLGACGTGYGSADWANNCWRGIDCPGDHTTEAARQQASYQHQMRLQQSLMLIGQNAERQQQINNQRRQEQIDWHNRMVEQQRQNKIDNALSDLSRQGLISY